MPYLWITILGGFVSFFNSWGIGANDVANSFATSVGSKVLTLKQALIIAGIFEFLGAFLMGSHVADTVRKKIVNIDIFENEPYALMLGMLCSNFSAGIWLTIATFFKYPVSTTHSIIGAIVGFAIAYGGSTGIVGSTIGYIVLSWLISPVISGVFSYSFFYMVRKFAFYSQNPFERTLKIFPILTFITFLINSFFIFYKGSPQLKLKDLPVWISVVTSFSIAIFISLLTQFLWVPYLRKKILNSPEFNSTLSLPQIPTPPLTTPTETINISPVLSQNLDNSNKNIIKLTDISHTEEYDTNIINNSEESNPNSEESNPNSEKSNPNSEESNPNSEETNPNSEETNLNSENNQLYLNDQSLDENILRIEEYHISLKNKKLTNEIETLHQNSEVFDPKSEKLCTWLQLITASLSSFAHGANDVANSIAPFATVYTIYITGEVSKKNEIPLWILAMGGIGIIIGLGTWGYKIIERIGKELTKITASRGFIIELSDALSVLIASRTGMPVSTTHCQIGSVVGCGLIDGKKNVQWKHIKNIILSWIITLPVTGFISAAMFSYAYYSPSSNYSSNNITL